MDPRVFSVGEHGFKGWLPSLFAGIICICIGYWRIKFNRELSERMVKRKHKIDPLVEVDLDTIYKYELIKTRVWNYSLGAIFFGLGLIVSYGTLLTILEIYK